MNLTLDVLLTQTIPPRSKFSVDQIPDLTGKVAAVTGGYGGIGYETVKVLLQKNATVIILGRSESKAKEAMAVLMGETSGIGSLEFVALDLVDLKSVRRGAEMIASTHKHLDILLLNGGIMNAVALTKEGIDLQFATNVLGHWFLATLLLPLLLASPNKSSGFPRVRLVRLSSHGSCWGIDFGSLNIEEGKEKPRSQLSGMALYGQSKMGNILISNALHRKFGDQGLVATAVHAGNIRTPMQGSSPFLQGILLRYLTYPPPQGALTHLYTGTMPEGKDFGGQYFIPWARKGRTRADAHDVELQEKLWKWCEEMSAGF